ncbi:hypothetical protein GYMLUDRAFT_64824 [Collybiopsis luxurians FD-317 M1]|uniref:Uncharacterized protein n=1 Tax=Collybiopsis luxurians FD-317 M1 TaxID=944289 RepID=A0A0D0BAX1_9AGAR|nr:hypothetical protein GYMLUDRAFT_64824 [Collybiopsis luxurians FD-317 M1]
MSCFPSLDQLAALRKVPHPPDTANRRTFTILVMHPDAPEPLLQPFGVNLVADLPVPVGQGAWLMSLNKVLKGSVYLPADASTGLLAFIQATETVPIETMPLCIFGDLPYTLPLCSSSISCTRTLSTRYCTAHAIALALDSHGELRNANAADKWALWSWFHEYILSSHASHSANPAIMIEHPIVIIGRCVLCSICLSTLFCMLVLML